MHRRFTDSVADSSQWDNRIATAATASIARLQLWHLARRAAMPGIGAAWERLLAVSLHIAKGLLDAPDFIRLPLMLTLERRRVEMRARAMFLEARAFEALTTAIRELTLYWRSVRCSKRALIPDVCST
jgi:hypothetical protein